MNKNFFLPFIGILLLSAVSFGARKPAGENLVVQIDPNAPFTCHNPSYEQFVNYAVQYLNKQYGNPNPNVRVVELLFKASDRPQLFTEFAKGPGVYSIELSLAKNDPSVWWQLGHELGHLIKPLLKHPFAEGFASNFGFEVTEQCGLPSQNWKIGLTREQRPTVYGSTYVMFRDLIAMAKVPAEKIVSLFTPDEPRLQPWLDSLPLDVRSDAFAQIKTHYPVIYSIRDQYTKGDHRLSIESEIKLQENGRVLEVMKLD